MSGKSKFWQEQTQSVFDTLLAQNPVELQGTTPLALGSHGMVVDHGDGTVSKVFVGGANPDEVKQICKDELQAMRLIGGMEFAGAASTYIISETQLKEGGAGIAMYRMPKMPGAEIDWNHFAENASDADLKRHFESAGRVLAAFHTQADALANITPPVKGMSYGAEVVQIPSLDATTNKALAACDAYLKAHMQPGVNHGDFHAKNFKVNDRFEVSGLFDISFAGRAANDLTDFAAIPEKGLPHAIKAYEDASGRKVDPVMLMMTKISQDAALVDWMVKNPARGPEALQKGIDTLKGHLAEVAHITSATPQPKQPNVAASAPKNG